MYNLYKLSPLRIFDENALVKPEHKNLKYDDIENHVISVKFKGNAFVLTSNPEYYAYCIENKKDSIESTIDDDDLESIVKVSINRLKREKLNPMEAALVYREVFEIANTNQRSLAQQLNITQGSISNKLRLLKLPFPIQREIIRERLKERHGRALLQLQSLPNYDEIAKKLTVQTIENNLRVSDLEQLIDAELGKPVKTTLALNLKEMKSKSEIKNREVIIALNQLERDMKQSIEKIEKFLPETKIEMVSGLNNADYVITVHLKDVDKEI